MTKHVEPKLGAASFTCGHCGALAHQTWFRVFADESAQDNGPWVATEEMVENLRTGSDSQIENREDLVRWAERASRREIFLERSVEYLSLQNVINLHLSLCYS